MLRCERLQTYTVASGDELSPDMFRLFHGVVSIHVTRLNGHTGMAVMFFGKASRTAFVVAGEFVNFAVPQTVEVAQIQADPWHPTDDCLVEVLFDDTVATVRRG